MKLINSFVAMFDFLGYKALRQAKGTEGLYKLYSQGLLPHIQHAAAGGGKIEKRGGRDFNIPDPGPVAVAYQAVSDTIVMTSSGDDFCAFLRIVMAAHRLLSVGFLGHQAPLRGAIGYGDMAGNEYGIWLGRAIEDAFEGEKSQVWAGCCLTQSCEEYAKSHEFILKMRTKFRKAADHPQAAAGERKKFLAASRYLVEYDIPLQKNPKDGLAFYSTRRGVAIDWTENMYVGAAKKSFQDTSDPHAQRIAQNTVEFENWARAQNR